MEIQVQNIYRKIAETINNMIPEEWYEFYFYAQVSDNGGGTYFFYNTIDEMKIFKYSLKIPYNFEVNRDKFKDYKKSLYELSEELRNSFKDNDQEPWYSFTLYLNREGKFKVSYDYTDWFKTSYSFSDQLVIWKHKYLNEFPEDPTLQQLITKYNEEYPHNPI